LDNKEQQTSDNNATASSSEHDSPIVKVATLNAPASDSPPGSSAQSSSPAPSSQLADLRSKRAGLAIAATAIVVVISGAYFWQSDLQQQQRLQQLQIDIAAALQRLDSQAAASREIQRQLDIQSNNRVEQQQQLDRQLQELQQQLASQHQRLLSLSTTDRADWLLAEAEYLMRLANQRLLMSEDVQSAQALLQAADNLMVELDDSALFAVRRVLAEDIAALRATATIDREGIYLQLAAAAQQAQQLRLNALPQQESVRTQDAQPKNWQQRLQSGLQAALQKLANYIQIKRRDEMYKPLLAPEYEAAVRQNLQLMFEQAQMATLAGNQRLYEDSLAKAKNWLTNYYTLDKTAAQALTATIDEQARKPVDVALPDISASLRALKHYLATIHNVALPAVTKKTTEQQSGKKVEPNMELQIEKQQQAAEGAQ
jgi:uroporphyrin-3 C-methyltransferase